MATCCTKFYTRVTMGVNKRSNQMILDVAQLLRPPVGMVLLGSQQMRPSVSQKFKGAKQHYEAMVDVFKEVVCVDLNGKFECWREDLSKPIYEAYDSFDIVYNGGTLEHVKNQQEAWKNAHYMLHEDGVAIHVCPLLGGWINHSLYLYQQSFFAELVAANKYKVIIQPQVVKHDRGQAVYVAWQKLEHRIFYWKQAQRFAVRQ